MVIRETLKMRQAEERSLNKQRAHKKKKKELLLKEKLIATQKYYANALLYIEIYYSPTY